MQDKKYIFIIKGSQCPFSAHVLLLSTLLRLLRPEHIQSYLKLQEMLESDGFYKSENGDKQSHCLVYVVFFDR